ncbi:hemerythrin domain-containing protein [Brevibacillus laterosporus]|uniref:hemerythrin domain-containing protein n=1 Tax=Brevibacillus laterosporus TaxID=1465 RepID=UPI0018F8AE4A|nr:hemerythrin [Brevibacillus laterosporus]
MHKELSPAFVQLKNEHGPLRQLMEELYEQAVTMGKTGDERSYVQTLRSLEEKVDSFLLMLEKHANREEALLFPMMYTLTGGENGPIAVMEEEHKEAKQHLARFKEKMSTVGLSIDKNTAIITADPVAKAYVVLSDHFMKEEMVLFPMANQLLLEEQKDELERRLTEADRKK